MGLTERLERAREVSVSVSGRRTTLDPDGKAEFFTLLKEVFSGGYEMPALGVSLDSEVQRALAEGVWVLFSFAKTEIYNEMPFDLLAVKLIPGSCGMEFMRSVAGKFGGRDYYYSLRRGKNADVLIAFAEARAGE